MAQNTESTPFDENAALEELQRLRDKIAISRRQRAETVAEFESFVRTFRQARLDELDAAASPSPAPAPPQATAPLDATLRQSDDVNRRVPPPAAAMPATASARASETMSREQEQQHTASEQQDAAPPIVRAPLVTGDPFRADLPWPGVPASASPRSDNLHLHDKLAKPARSRRQLVTIGAVVAGLAFVAVLVTRPWSNTAGDAQPAASPSPSASATPASAPIPPPAPPAPARTINLVLTTVRPAWTRITVDDVKLFERLIAANEKIAIGADRVVVIRSGDPGAIRASFNGKDLGALGRDGIPATRIVDKAGIRAIRPESQE